MPKATTIKMIAMSNGPTPYMAMVIFGPHRTAYHNPISATHTTRQMRDATLGSRRGIDRASVIARP